MNGEQRIFAEWVSPGHPDRLADGIAESIVNAALKIDSDALVGIEVAVHTNAVFIDGRVAAGHATPALDLGGICGQVYRNAGYSKAWGPAPEELRITHDLCQEPLSADERLIRQIADDQNVVIGYACNLPVCNFLPPAHWLAHRIGHAIREWRETKGSTQFGPDFKVLPRLRVKSAPGRTLDLAWDRLTLSIQHAPGIGYEEQHRILFPVIRATLGEAQAEGLKGVADSFDVSCLHLNGAGDFCQGGPHGDNGLSGKKLVVDHYGPTVPIGGGALSGKDPHKIDRCGALRARQLAKALCRQGAQEAWVTLSWAPGESVPSLREVRQTPRPGGVIRLPDPEWFSIPAIVRDLELCAVDWPAAVRSGYLADTRATWER
ncbi:MAG: methionine adenosyltransferase domain-containing protein [Lentisphaerae bacterium]|nr:methionine adenosyltransferase domain-containing protein [Lentisphaerota bacterium]